MTRVCTRPAFTRAGDPGEACTPPTPCIIPLCLPLPGLHPPYKAMQKRRLRPNGPAPRLQPLRAVRATRTPPPWLTRRRAWVKDGSRESFSAISSGRYFSSMARPPALLGGPDYSLRHAGREENHAGRCGHRREAGKSSSGKKPPRAGAEKARGNEAAPVAPFPGRNRNACCSLPRPRIQRSDAASNTTIPPPPAANRD